MVLLLPWFLLLLPIAALAWRFPRRVTDARHGLLRSLVLLLLVLALARPVAVTDSAAAHHVLVLDRPAGASPALAEEFAGAAREGDVAVLIVIGGGADARGFDGAISLPEDASLGDALALASRSIPRGAAGSITLVTDGLAPQADWAAAAQDLAARGVPVHAVALEGPGADLRPVRAVPLGELRVGETGRLAVDLAGSGSADVALLRAGPAGPFGELARAEGVRVDGRATIVLELEPEEPGFLEALVEVRAPAEASPTPENDALPVVLAVQDPLRVLYLGQRVQGGAEQLARLVGPGFELDPVSPSDADLASELEGYDLALLDDVPASAVPASFQAQLVDAVVNAGLGLVMSGGQAAFGPGGWHETSVAGVLPVDFVQKEEKRDPSTTLVVIIDTSGSMGGSRVELAKETARLAIKRLLPHDKCGIVEFYGAKRWAAPIQPASNAIELERALNRLNAGGGTVILPAIEEAFYALKNVQTRFKHVLVLTDGGVEQGAFEPLLRAMAEDGINVSSVLIGPDAHSEFLVSLANWGKGRFYSVPNRFNLPEILLKQPASAVLPAWRPGPHAVRARGGAGWWGMLDPSSVPELSGYVEARARPGAQVLLETADKAHPVLATWSYGLGRATALLTEPTGAGTESWREWEGYGALLARVLARTASGESAPFEWSIARRGRELVVTAVRAAPGAALPAAVLQGESGAADASLAFRERAPGMFEARALLDPRRGARVLARAAGDTASETRLALAAPGPAARLQADPRDALDLAGLAAATGGTLRAAGADLSAAPAAGGEIAPAAVRALWPWSALGALLAYLGELVYRRRDVRRR